MAGIKIKDAAVFLGVSDDTIRRWVENGSLRSHVPDKSRDAAEPGDPGKPGSAGNEAHRGPAEVDAVSLAELAKANAVLPDDPSAMSQSARNRFVGLVTEVISDKVMSQVQIQCGPHQVVSLISTEAVRELGLKPGSVAVAVIKATNVILEAPRAQQGR
ncbi:TOBE domain-containing protein [Pseudarthrobacter sp. J1738]|uniref:TOBE domain-containing protein n=1 Tax=unclassified Pseudarthrobacter TaxID=2647000 RepID=UPI003D2E237D